MKKLIPIEQKYCKEIKEIYRPLLNKSLKPKTRHDVDETKLLEQERRKPGEK